MKNNTYFLLAIICFITGFILIALQKNLIILNFEPNFSTTNPAKTSCYKKTVALYFWKNNSWQTEKNEILWSADQAHNIHNLVQNWLSLLDEEKLVLIKIDLQSTILTQNNQTVYLSFDHNLLSKELSTYQKILLIESLLKTLRANQISVPNIQFLVNHQILNDPHLDFSYPWPIVGFMQN